jgi:hypothetical protein
MCFHTIGDDNFTLMIAAQEGSGCRSQIETRRIVFRSHRRQPHSSLARANQPRLTRNQQPTASSAFGVPELATDGQQDASHGGAIYMAAAKKKTAKKSTKKKAAKKSKK